MKLIPMADLLNHHTTHPNAFLTPHQDGSWAMRTTCDVPAGAELFNTYGELASSQLLSRFGFTSVPNPHDFVRLDMRCMLEHDVHADLATRLLSPAEWPCVVVSEWDAFEPPDAMTLCAAIAGLSQVQVKKLLQQNPAAVRR